MFKNFININDFSILRKAVREGKLDLILSKITSSKEGKVKKSWEHTKQKHSGWIDIPEVIERCNYLVSGDTKIDYCEYIFRKYFPNKKHLKGLTLGCGTGDRELKLAELGIFESIDAYDLSESRIKFAKKEAEKRGFDGIINYRVADVYNIKGYDNYYDVVLVEQSLHHFSPLKNVLLKINNFLKPDGLFIVNEFVGPTRFQWTNRQLEAINGLLSILPVKYRRERNGKIVKKKVFRQSKLSMLLIDPSEAIESSNILTLLKETFDTKEIKEYGGPILLILFYEIAHNFLSKNKETKHYLDICFDVEDALLESGDIQSDFIVAVCKKLE